MDMNNKFKFFLSEYGYFYDKSKLDTIINDIGIDNCKIF